MTITDYINNAGPGVYAITGGAGAGKSTLAYSLIGYPIYSIDWRFIGDSAFRKRMLATKQLKGIDSLKDACNQFNWWDWDAIEKDVTDLLAGKTVTVPRYYNRETGLKDADIQVVGVTPVNPQVIVEGALLGPDSLINRFKGIFIVQTLPEVRLARLIKKDITRRSVGETCARFLITEFSETRYYQHLQMWGPTPINDSGEIMANPWGYSHLPQFIPVAC